MIYLRLEAQGQYIFTLYKATQMLLGNF